jgi:DNA-binding NarL/FixJ family response regulator
MAMRDAARLLGALQPLDRAPRVALFGSDTVRLARLALLLADDRRLVMAGAEGDPDALDRLHASRRIDVVLALAPSAEWIAGWRTRAPSTPVAVMVEPAAALDSGPLLAGARAVLAHDAEPAAIVSALTLVADGQAVLPQALLSELVPPTETEAPPPNETELTPREREVLAALADGVSNKAIARRLGISHHTAKFHVAGILTKLDADTRTEAVAKAAHRGLILL